MNRSCSISLKEVLDTCRSFLSEHPTETIIIHLNNDRDCIETVDTGGQYQSGSNCGNKRIETVNNLTKDCYTKREMPTRGAVKGQIVIATRTTEYNGIYINVPYNSDEKYAVEVSYANNYRCLIQDGCDLRKREKWEAIKMLANNEELNNNDVLALNFMSKTVKSFKESFLDNLNIKDVADEIGEKLISEDIL